MQTNKATHWSVCLAAVLLVVSGNHAADLRTDLREMLSLVPRQRVGYIAARHFITDARFRQATNFIRSMAFAQTWRQMRDAKEFAAVVDYMRQHAAGFDVTRIIDRIPSRLRSFRIPEQVPPEMMNERNLGSFLREVVRALPRDSVSDWLARKVKENGDFARLYRALTQPNFQRLLRKARHARSLSAPLATLSRNGIDVDELLEIGFTLLSWGPPL